ncbi:MAG TPA: DUF5666 domain-containing protein [Candidatus Angelobacter sp.]
MSSMRRFAVCLALGMIVSVALQAQQQPPSPAAPAQSGQRISKAGAIKSIDGLSLVLKPDSGPDIAVTLTSDARLMRLGPGQTDLKSAEAITLKDVQVGDRILVRGQPGATPGSILGFSAVIMKQSDVAQKQQQELQDWQRRGTGGIVNAVDAASGTLAVDVNPTLKVTVKTSSATRFLRYAPDSVRFSDAQKSSLDQIKTGDQLRARGTRSADGKELAAEEVISGTFRNIAGTITNVDAAAGTVTVKDVLAKRNVTVKLTGDSMMRKLPAQMAQRIAFFLKAPEAAQAAAAAGTGGAGPAAGGAGGGRAPDFQQMISRLPAVTIAELQKDDAVMIVSTPGDGGPQVTAITLLGGVEPIITASPSSAAALLGGWNLSAPSGDAGPQ